MWRFFAPELRRRLSDLQAAASTADRVRAALHEILPAGDSAMAAVAHELATSPRTLQRQLQAEGTSYQTVLTSTREELARHYLTNSTLSTAKIAYLLAYDDTNSFYRAFRTWRDAPPTPFGPNTPHARTPCPSSRHPPPRRPAGSTITPWHPLSMSCGTSKCNHEGYIWSYIPRRSWASRAGGAAR
ncbi:MULTISPECIES: helix-turn-helix domain-containing protein [unclassified Pseudofrankia]|uniref:helix-turn-helix domain-containing protein n=1 Tax=unclassified Pseudofrankia TaxID=2994372 RepID=UPI0009F260F7|nr:MULTISPECIES: AraC family transcriptional regulator [unclassified Pseudofrankia]MDT3446732.1 AraC family transcriptional regulator [Pseudofrankia sp. BMG5.37]